MGARVFRHLAGTIAVTCAELFLASCSKPVTLEGEVLARVVSPDGAVAGVVTVLEGPATVPDSYRVYIEDKGPDKGISEVLRMDHGEVPKIAWVANTLRVEAPCGQIYRFSNFTTLGVATNFRYVPVLLENRGLCERRN